MQDDLLRPSPFFAKKDKWIIDGEHCFVYENEYPVIDGHALILPKREIEKFDELSIEEWAEIHVLTNQYIEQIGAIGFNLGHNSGKIAGQSVAHIHFHIFPYFENDAGLTKGGMCLAFDNVPDYYKN